MTQRKIIRHTIRDLVAAIPALGGRVHASRAHPVPADKPNELPCVLVYTDRDPATRLDSYTRRRDLALRIVVIVRNDTDADDELDDLCEAIEQALEAALSGELSPEPVLATLIDNCDYVDTALTYSGEEGRADFVHAEMTYTAQYYRSPAQSFADLGSIGAEFDMAAPDGQIDARADIVFPVGP